MHRCALQRSTAKPSGKPDKCFSKVVSLEHTDECLGSRFQAVDNTEVRPDAEGYLKLTQSGVSDSFAQDLTDTEKLVLYSAQSPTAGAALGGTVSAPAWRGKTCRYLVATNDRAIQPALQRSMAKRLNAAVVEVAANHVAMLSHPQEVATLIAG